MQQIRGGGVGQFNGCTNEWGAPSSGWGKQYGGISSRSACDSFPDKLKPGCYWHFDWFQGADNPSVTFKQVACPAALTAKSGCVRANDAINEAPTGPSSPSTYTSGAGSPPSTRTTCAAAATIYTTVTVAAPSSSSEPDGDGSGNDNSATAPQYAQCGGTGCTGPTVCAALYMCMFNSDYYSQCW